MEKTFEQHLRPCQDWSGVADVRIKGGIGVLELEKPVEMAEITRRFVDRGVWLRPFGKLVYVMPPYIIEPGELQHLLTTMKTTVREELSRHPD
jgi:adenosylmethionine-8-amino-7-oxononanoate aminotransferase